MSRSDVLSRDFKRLWWSESISMLGSSITVLALSTIVVLTLDGTAQDVGWLNSVRWLPYLFLGLVVGALVDRHRRRPLMVATDLGRAALLLLIPAAWATDLLSLPLVLLVTAGLGTASLISDAAYMSFLPRLVPRHLLQRAHARIDTTDAVAQSAGPALAGVLIKLLGAPIAVLVDAASYLVSALLVLRVRAPEETPVPTSTPNVLREIRAGVRWVYRGSGLLLLATTTHLWFVGNAVLGAVLAPFALTTLALTPFQFGLAAAVAGIGGIGGAALSVGGGRLLGAGGAIITMHVLTALGTATMVCAVLVDGSDVGNGSWATTAVLACGQGLFGLGLMFGNSHESAYRQAVTPDHLQARTITTMRSFNRAIIVVGAPLGGLLAVQTSNTVALTAAAIIFTSVPLILLFSPVRTLRYDYR